MGDCFWIRALDAAESSDVRRKIRGGELDSDASFHSQQVELLHLNFTFVGRSRHGLLHVKSGLGLIAR